MEKVNITIIGAGVVGLSIARELSKVYKDIFVIEKNFSFGQETSSRNSEVIHSGIYYPKDSLKAKTCVEGRRLLYEFCLKNKVAHKRIGKCVVAIENNELKALENLFRQGLENGVEDLELFSPKELKKIEPYVEAQAAIYSSSTGIIDSHSLMENLLEQFKGNNGLVAYNTELTGMNKVRGGFEVTVEDKREGSFKFSTRILINSSGLNADKVSAMAGIAKEEYKLKYCKGDYFRVRPSKAKFINRLIYPVPKGKEGGLGIHATLDLTGSLRLGPDDEYVDKINYNVDSSKAKLFYESARRFLPFIELADLSPDISGIRPKLQGPEQDFKDFIIKDETDSGLSGFINLIGIESPGLTACLSIAGIVKGFLVKYFF